MVLRDTQLSSRVQAQTQAESVCSRAPVDLVRCRARTQLWTQETVELRQRLQVGREMLLRSQQVLANGYRLWCEAQVCLLVSRSIQQDDRR